MMVILYRGVRNTQAIKPAKQPRIVGGRRIKLRACAVCGHDCIGDFCGKHWVMIPKTIKPEENRNIPLYRCREILDWFRQVGEM